MGALRLFTRSRVRAQATPQEKKKRKKMMAQALLFVFFSCLSLNFVSTLAFVYAFSPIFRVAFGIPENSFRFFFFVLQTNLQEDKCLVLLFDRQLVVLAVDADAGSGAESRTLLQSLCIRDHQINSTDPTSIALTGEPASRTKERKEGRRKK